MVLKMGFKPAPVVSFQVDFVEVYDDCTFHARRLNLNFVVSDHADLFRPEHFNLLRSPNEPYLFFVPTGGAGSFSLYKRNSWL